MGIFGSNNHSKSCTPLNFHKTLLHFCNTALLNTQCSTCAHGQIHTHTAPHSFCPFINIFRLTEYLGWRSDQSNIEEARAAKWFRECGGVEFRGTRGPTRVKDGWAKLMDPSWARSGGRGSRSCR